MSDTFAVISDIHANLEALEAVMKRIDGLRIDDIICLGDVIGYGADPLPCWKIAHERCEAILEGNHESILLGRTSTEHCSALGRASADWAAKQVPPRLRSTFDNLPKHFEKYGAHFFHASPNAVGWPYLNSLDDIIDSFKNYGPLVFYGHTHRPRITIVDHNGSVISDDKPQYSCHVEVDLNNVCCYINPGSVGQQRDGHTDASFVSCKLAHSKLSIDLFRIDYDSLSAYHKIRNAGYPELATFLIREITRREKYELLDNGR